MSKLQKPTPLELQSLEPRLALAVADTTAPTVRAVAAPKAQVYGAGSTLSFRLTFSENVIVTGIPTLPITIGDSVRQAAWNGKGSGRNSLVFTTAVQSGDRAPTGVSIDGPIGLSSGATIRDKAGNSLIPALRGVFSKVMVDAIGPSMTGLGSVTVTPRLVSLPVTFSEPVTIKGRPSIPFTLGGVPKQLVYASGSGKNVIMFSYRPAKGEAATATNVNLPMQTIGLNGGAITDKARNAAASLAKPTDVQLSATSVPENQPSGAVVGTLSAVDADGSRDRHAFTLVAGAGSADNTSFQIVGNQLRTAATFDFETKSSYSVRIRVTDSGGLSIEKAIVITVTNVDDVVIQFVKVGDAGNAPDTGLGRGTVGYDYRIGKYETTIGQYAKFLNAVAQTDTYGLYSPSMGSDLNIAGISRSGMPGSYSYTVMNNDGDSSNRPIAYVSWFDAARFANWMHNGQPSGLQQATTTEDGAYTLNGATSGTAPAKNEGARFYIPTRNEWYKAAYYKGGSTDAGYWDYATKSDIEPSNSTGDGANHANYYAGTFTLTQSADYSGSQNYLTDVGSFTGSASYYGTFDQSGNVAEWHDVTGESGSRGTRGGGWYYLAIGLSSAGGYSNVEPSTKSPYTGFRLASPT